MLWFGSASFYVAYSLLFPPTLLWLALVFPHPIPVVRRHPWLEYTPFLIGLVMLPLLAITNGIAGFAWTIFSIVGSIAILIHSAFTMRDSSSRAQLLWGVWGFILGSLMILATFLVTFGLVSGVLADVITYLGNLSFAVIGITLGIAILRYRLFDIDVIIRRTLTYAVVTASLIIIFFGTVIVLQQFFAQLTVSGGNELVTVLSTLAIAALFVPLRNRVQAWIDRRFNRNKYNAQKVLQQFGETVRDETDLEKLTAQLMQVVNETMQPKSVSVWLKEQKRGRVQNERV